MPCSAVKVSTESNGVKCKIVLASRDLAASSQPCCQFFTPHYPPNSSKALFFDLVTSETLLVGHSLENDLKALKVVHSRVLDTVLLFPHPKGLPYRSALKVLAQKFLKRRIQV